MPAPPLRDRREEIRPLAQYLLGLAAARTGRADVTGFADGVLELLESDDWPGNVRALENCIERAVLLTRGSAVSLDALPARILARAAASAMPVPMTAPAELARHAPPLTLVANDDGADPFQMMPPPTGNGAVDLRAAVDALESRLIRRALAQTNNNNKQRAAEMLGIERTTLLDMMKRKGLAA